MAWITGSAILDHVQIADPSAADEAWADTVAAALEAEIDRRLEDTAVTDADTSGFAPTIKAMALQDGAAAYIARKAPHGVLSVGPDGEVARLGADIIRALDPILIRAAGPGIG